MTHENFGLLISVNAGERPFGRAWWVHAPWAHPLWHSYVVSLCDLTTPTGKAPNIVLLGATHELLVYALNPKYPNTSIPPHKLTPANHGYQFIAESDADAEHRVFDLVKAVAEGRLSPDTDYTRAWDELFADGASLRLSAHLPQPGQAVH